MFNLASRYRLLLAFSAESSAVKYGNTKQLTYIFEIMWTLDILKVAISSCVIKIVLKYDVVRACFRRGRERRSGE